jgi:hypothetical protein
VNAEIIIKRVTSAFVFVVSHFMDNDCKFATASSVCYLENIVNLELNIERKTKEKNSNYMNN